MGDGTEVVPEGLDDGDIVGRDGDAVGRGDEAGDGDALFGGGTGNDVSKVGVEPGDGLRERISDGGTSEEEILGPLGVGCVALDVIGLKSRILDVLPIVRVLS